MFKIGLFTFGGGYAMIAIIERELVERKKWLGHDEFMDIIAIAESSPGPIAINSATYVGYKRGGVLGSVFSTLGVVLPSFIVIFIISLFFDRFLELTYVGYAFRGIQACVIFLIASAGIKMIKHMKATFFNITLTSATIIIMILFTLFSVNFSTIFYILIGGGLGVFLYLFKLIRGKIEPKDADRKDVAPDSSARIKKEGEEDDKISDNSLSENKDLLPALSENNPEPTAGNEKNSNDVKCETPHADKSEKKQTHSGKEKKPKGGGKEKEGRKNV